LNRLIVLFLITSLATCCGSDSPLPVPIPADVHLQRPEKFFDDSWDFVGYAKEPIDVGYFGLVHGHVCRWRKPEGNRTRVRIETYSLGGYPRSVEEEVKQGEVIWEKCRLYFDTEGVVLYRVFHRWPKFDSAFVEVHCNNRIISVYQSPIYNERLRRSAFSWSGVDGIQIGMSLDVTLVDGEPWPDIELLLRRTVEERVRVAAHQGWTLGEPCPIQYFIWVPPRNEEELITEYERAGFEVIERIPGPSDNSHVRIRLLGSINLDAESLARASELLRSLDQGFECYYRGPYAGMTGQQIRESCVGGLNPGS